MFPKPSTTSSFHVRGIKVSYRLSARHLKSSTSLYRSGRKHLAPEASKWLGLSILANILSHARHRVLRSQSRELFLFFKGLHAVAAPQSSLTRTQLFLKCIPLCLSSTSQPCSSHVPQTEDYRSLLFPLPCYPNSLCICHVHAQGRSSQSNFLTESLPLGKQQFLLANGYATQPGNLGVIAVTALLGLVVSSPSPIPLILCQLFQAQVQTLSLALSSQMLSGFPYPVYQLSS